MALILYPKPKKQSVASQVFSDMPQPQLLQALQGTPAAAQRTPQPPRPAVANPQARRRVQNMQLPQTVENLSILGRAAGLSPERIAAARAAGARDAMPAVRDIRSWRTQVSAPPLQNSLEGALRRFARNRAGTRESTVRAPGGGFLDMTDGLWHGTNMPKKFEDAYAIQPRTLEQLPVAEARALASQRPQTHLYDDTDPEQVANFVMAQRDQAGRLGRISRGEETASDPRDAGVTNPELFRKHMQRRRGARLEAYDNMADRMAAIQKQRRERGAARRRRLEYRRDYAMPPTFMQRAIASAMQRPGGAAAMGALAATRGRNRNMANQNMLNAMRLRMEMQNAEAERRAMEAAMSPEGRLFELYRNQVPPEIIRDYEARAGLGAAGGGAPNTAEGVARRMEQVDQRIPAILSYMDLAPGVGPESVGRDLMEHLDPAGRSPLSDEDLLTLKEWVDAHGHDEDWGGLNAEFPSLGEYMIQQLADVQSADPNRLRERLRQRLDRFHRGRATRRNRAITTGGSIYGF